MTRKGQPCQRQPLPASEYCPSHQHLTETFEELELPDLRGSPPPARRRRDDPFPALLRRFAPHVRFAACARNARQAAPSASTSAARSPMPCSPGDGRLFTAKVPTTPADQSEGVMAAVDAVARRAPESSRARSSASPTA